MLPSLKVLFLCTGNSCRSQMAEGWTRALKLGQIEAYSAGTDPGRLDPLAVKVMGEAGVDISEHFSKSLEDLHEETFDVVVTVCDAASETCPVLPGDTVVVHRGFDDPPRLARDAGSEEEALQPYRRVRDEIRRFVDALPGSLQNASGRSDFRRDDSDGPASLARGQDEEGKP